MKRENKTNAARLLDRAGIAYELNTYPVDENDLSAIHVAESLGVDAGRCTRRSCCAATGRVFRMRRTRRCRGRPEEGGQGIGQQEGRPRSGKGATAADGVCPRRVFTHRDEETLPHIHRCGCRAAGADIHQCRCPGGTDCHRPGRPHGFRGGGAGGFNHRVN